jgi:ribulose-5-phosphate 4-epimerase/fuculose-1-phosphate aldolase
LTVGGSIDEAAMWFIRMEQFCRMQLTVEAAGTAKLIDHEVAMKTRDQVGKPVGGWFSFQDLYEQIVEDHPELLD